jgi:hypothetical protein
VLIIVAAALFALVAIVALAVDLGNVMRERRYMQNAADAGALAGAQEICFGDASLADDKAWEYAVDRNSAEGAEITVHGVISVTVVATKTVDTFFAGLIGFKEIPIDAEAAALCGKAAAAGGVWPVGFDSRRWYGEYGAENMPCGSKLIIWQDGRADCENYNCCVLYDKNGAIKEFLPCGEDWEPLVYPFDGRTWVDFSAGISGSDPCEQGGCSANETDDRIRGEDNQGNVCESFITFPDCFAVPQGVQANAWKATEDAAGEIHTIPLYDPCYSGKVGDEPIADPAYCPPPTDPDLVHGQVCSMDTLPGGNCTQDRFYINELVCLQIGAVENPGDPEDEWVWDAAAYLAPLEDDYKSNELVKVIIATIPCDESGGPPDECGTAPGWTTGEPPEPGDVKAVSLIK